MSPKVRVWGAWALLVGSLIAWPITALTVFREEPQGILGLSFLAIVLTAADIVSTQDVRKQQEGE
jgi:hypothetical protein